MISQAEHMASNALNYALATLLRSNVKMEAFIKFALEERRKLQNGIENACEDVWKYNLLADSSLDLLSNTFKGSGDAWSLFPVLRDLTGSSQPENFSNACQRGPLNNLPGSNMGFMISGYHSHPETPMTSGSNSDCTPVNSLLCIARTDHGKIKPKKKGSPQQDENSHVTNQRVTASTVDKTKVPQQQQLINGGRKRLSSRRIPEKQDIIQCPECGKRGQSIFDPKLEEKYGQVYEYYYCRNANCIKGSSTNRYIGWTIRT